MKNKKVDAIWIDSREKGTKWLVGYVQVFPDKAATTLRSTLLFDYLLNVSVNFLL